MSHVIAVEDILQAAGPVLVAAATAGRAGFSRAVIDSRLARPGDLFFALRGERHDGHDFVAQAAAAGATGAIVERPVAVPDGVALFHVRDPLEALQRLAAHRRDRHDVRVVGVTGSVGKTTGKELIAAVLGRRFSVLKNEANLNTEIGLPLTLLDLTGGHERAVLEMAMHARGEIGLLCRIARPQVGVVTNIGPVHLERLGSLGAIAAAKAELVESLPGDGVAILNGDDPRTAALAARTRARRLLYGQSPQCQVRGDELVSHGLDGISFRLTCGEASAAVSTPLPGRHHLYPCLAAAAVAFSEGISLAEITDSLAAARPALRLRVLPGPNGSTIIDDSYNASPLSMTAALDLLAELPGRRIALLGEMRELGSAEEQGHRAVGERAAASADLLFVIGERARPLAEGAEAAGRTPRLLESKEQAAELLRRELRAGDHLLVKSSRALALDTVVEALALPAGRRVAP